MNELQLRKELKRIGDRNRRFKAMTKARKRVTIAKDTIAVLKAQKIVATPGTYLSSRVLDNGEKLPDKYRCNACALGSMFVGLTTRIKDLSVQRSSSRNDVTEPLTPYYSDEQLDFIESAFETDLLGWQSSDSNPIKHKAVDFGSKYDDPNERLQAIMQNIVDNNGTFKP